MGQRFKRTSQNSIVIDSNNTKMVNKKIKNAFVSIKNCIREHFSLKVTETINYNFT